jgi:phosphoglycolate phosphatase
MEVVRTFVGDGARLLLSRAFGLLAASAELDAPYATFLAYYQAHPVVKTTLLPGVHESLDALRGKKVALCTNKTRKTALLVLEALSLTDRFHAIFGAGDGPLKPDPFPVRFVLDAVGIPPERAWMVGDSPQDILAGRAAGCGATVGVLQGFTEPEKLHASEPDIVLDSLLALPVLVR